jgi:hypothetical protein
LEECGFVVKKISADGWEITGLGQSSSVHAYGEARLRELTSELAWEKWVIGRAPDGAGSPRNAQTGNPQVMLPDRQAAGHQSADQGGTAEEPDREAAAPEPEEGFLSRLIGGDLGLAKTYWVYSVLGGVVASLFSRSITSPAALAWFVLILAVYQVLVSIGIWNAAGKYTGWAIWAVLARIAVVIGAVLLLVVVAGTLATMDGSSRGADSQPAHPPSSGTVNGQEYKGVFERCMTYPPNVNSFSASELKSYCHSLAKTWATAR